MKKILSLAVLVTFLFSNHGIAAESVKVASIFATTGEAAQQNATSIRGAQLAVNVLNDRGGVLGKKIELIVLNNESTPIGAMRAGLKAVKLGVKAIIGCSWSSHSLALAKVAQEHEVPMISNISTNPKVTEVGDYIFRVCYIDPFQGKVMASFAANDLKAQTAVIITAVNSDYSLGLSEEFRNNFTELGGQVLAEFNYLQKDTNYKKTLRAVKELNADVLFLSGHDESGNIIKQAQEIGITSVAMGGDGWASSSFLDRGGSLLKEGYYSTHWAVEASNQRIRDFLEANAASYSEALSNSDFILAYDAVMLLADAVRRAGSWDNEEVRDALAQTDGFPAITGDITMNENGDPIKGAVIIKITNGKSKFLKNIQP